MSASALSFARSIAEVIYPKGAIVVCRSCGKPLYRLQASIYVGENAGSATSRAKFAPVSPTDLQAIIDRSDVEPGQRALVKAMSLEDRRLHCERIPVVTAGMLDTCPACGASFTFGRAKNDAEGADRFNSREYVIALAILPPEGHARRAPRTA